MNHEHVIRSRYRAAVVNEIDELIEQILVDAYGDDEQLWSFRQWFEDDASFPFTATVVGTDVRVVEVDYDGDDRRGLTARVVRDGEEHRVSLLDVIPARSIPTGTAKLLAAYRRWARAETDKGGC